MMRQKEIAFRSLEQNKHTLSELLLERQIFLDAPCGGKGVCGRCKVRFLEGAPEAVKREQEVLTPGELAAGYRLACQTIPCRDCLVLLPEDAANHIAVVDKAKPEVGDVKPEAAAAGKPVVDREKPEAGDRSRGEIEREQPAGDAAGEQSNASKKWRSGFVAQTAACGLAVDIGTTTLVMALYELSAGRQLGVRASVNHQRAYGADVLARITAASQGRAGMLKKTIQNDLRQMVIVLLQQCRVSPSQVRHMVIAANTTMCHLLLGYDTAALGSAPFTPVNIGWIERSYAEVFGSTEISAPVTILPGISAFVGADIVAGIYACGMAERKESALFLDVGTNGEMAAGGSDGIFVTSTAAGPVFEGGGIANGMPGVPGAVSHLTLTADGEIERIETIGDKAPIGLCGSGIVDFVGELVRHRLVDENGTLQEPWFLDGIPAGEPKLRLYQKDIREFQMGKAAIRAGIDRLTAHAQASGAVIDRIYLAGGFGYGLSAESAIRTGLFPADFAGRVRVLGNSALAGAARYLLEREDDKVNRILRLAESINLAEEPGFYDRYVAAMQFEGLD